MSPVHAQLLVDARCTLGEGLTWHVGHAAWFWVDIQERALWMFRPADGEIARWTLPDRAGAFGFTQSGQVLIGLSKSLVLASVAPDSPGSVSTTPLIFVDETLPTTRVNDGRPDRSGNFVFGTMNEEASESAIGSIYQYSAAHGLRRLPLDPVAISNSICFNPEGDRIYYADSVRRQIMCGRYDASRANVSDVRVFADLGSEGPLPDGSIVDAEGALWNAEWGGSAVRRYDCSGHASDLVTVAAPHVTCPAFGGPTLSDLATTTARWMMEDAAVAAIPTAGGLFGCALSGVRGIAEMPIAGL